MAFFRKLRDKLRRSSSKIEEGLEAIVREGGEAEDIEVPEAGPETGRAEAADAGGAVRAASVVPGAVHAVTSGAEPMPGPPARLPELPPEPAPTDEPDVPGGAPADGFVSVDRPAETALEPAEPDLGHDALPGTAGDRDSRPDGARASPADPEAETPVGRWPAGAEGRVATTAWSGPPGAPEPARETTPYTEPMARPAPVEERPAEAPPFAEAPHAQEIEPEPEPVPAPEPPAEPEPEPEPVPPPVPEPERTPEPVPEPPAPDPGPAPEPVNVPPPPPEVPPPPPAELPVPPSEVPDWTPSELPPPGAPLEMPYDRGASPRAALERGGVEEVVEDEEEEAPRQGFFGRMLGRTIRKKTVIRRELDDDMLESLEELLITADMGVDTAMRVTANMAEGRFGKRLSVDEIKELLAQEIARIMEPVARPMPLYPRKPQVVLVVGVNGSGKTTTIGKLASQFRDAGKSVIIAAGDTFRAAAVEQLQIWGKRAGVPVMTAAQGADPASLAFDAMARAEAEGTDLLLIDTAGRLQNRQDLMAELEKIVRVIRKRDATAPHNTLLVLDATTGQNALSQVEIFQKLADVSGLVMTKLDGTAKGGVLVALADRFGLPIHAIGVGEQIDDLAPFEPEDFARALAGID